MLSCTNCNLNKYRLIMHEKMPRLIIPGRLRKGGSEMPNNVNKLAADIVPVNSVRYKPCFGRDLQNFTNCVCAAEHLFCRVKGMGGLGQASPSVQCCSSCMPISPSSLGTLVPGFKLFRRTWLNVIYEHVTDLKL
jgi:hypothetical protein